jgi:endonuclease YncB( thermonuclease family)
VSRTVITLLLIVESGLVAADILTGHVVKIADGDTITVLDSSFNLHKIRLTGIDAPKSGQPYGTVSGDNLGKMVFGREATAVYEDQDRYGRT